MTIFQNSHRITRQSRALSSSIDKQNFDLLSIWYGRNTCKSAIWTKVWGVPDGGGSLYILTPPLGTALNRACMQSWLVICFETSPTVAVLCFYRCFVWVSFLFCHARQYSFLANLNIWRHLCHLHKYSRFWFALLCYIRFIYSFRVSVRVTVYLDRDLAYIYRHYYMLL